MSIYLDYNASAPIDPRVLDVMIDVYKNHIGNASSRTHEYGDHARDIVEKSRKSVANLLGVSASEIIFTSGSTESNNIAIQGLQAYALKSGKNHIITTSIEHKAVLETVNEMQKRSFEVDIIEPCANGRIDYKRVIEKVKDTTLVVSVMHVNNETGIIQPIEELGNELEKRNVLFHVDATQSCGKLVPELRKIKYNMLSFSAHKLRGPQGIGVLVIRRKSYNYPPVKAIMFGGGQERGIRPGTIPVALVGGCGKACEIAEIEYKDNLNKCKKIKKELIKLLNESRLTFSFNGEQRYCVDSTVNVCIHGVSSEALMLATKDYCSVSNGSACTAKSYNHSYVLQAMKIPTNQIESSIRISWGPDIDIEAFKNEFKKFLDTAKLLVQND